MAKDKKIHFGDNVEVSSHAGKVVLKAYPTEKIGPNMVFLSMDLAVKVRDWTLAYKSGANDNAVIEDIIEPVYGASVMHETNVEIKRV